MIPKNLRIKGFLSYQEETNLDFSSLHVACISGMNGAGKSSILDAITWCLFGEARQRNDALINLKSETAEVELEFIYENNLYRVYRARKRTKTTQLEFFIQKEDQSWKDLSERTLTNTQNLINQTLRMDYETFINASFFLQGKADQFARQTPGKRKEILSKILGLEKWEQYKNRTLGLRREFEQKKIFNDNRIEEKEAELNRANEYQTHLVTLEKESELLQSQLGQKELQLNQFKDQEKKLNALQNQSQEKKNRLISLTNTIKETKTKISQKKTQLAQLESIITNKKEIEKKFKEFQTTQILLQDLNHRQSQISTLNEKKYALQLVIAREKEKLQGELNLLTEQQKNAKTINAQIKKNQNQKEDYQKQVGILEIKTQDLSDLSHQKETFEKQKTDNLAENKHLRSTMLDLENRIDDIQSLKSSNCPYCEQPLSESHRNQLIAETKSKGKDLGDKYRQNNLQNQTITKALDETETQIKALEKNTQEIELLKHKIEHLENEINGQQKNTFKIDDAKQKKLQSLIETNSFSKDAHTSIQVIEKQILAIDYHNQNHNQAKQTLETLKPYQEQNQQLQIAIATQNEIKTTLLDLETRLSQDSQQEEIINNEIAEIGKTIENQSLKEQSSSLSGLIQSLSVEIQNKKDAFYASQLEVGGAKQSVHNLKTIKKQKQTLKEENNVLLEKIASYKEIERAFGREGVPALLIEQAIPEIENRANEILRKLTQDEMTLSLITQEEYKDKNRDDLKETMEIKIHDKLGSRDYEMFSGGETFRINFALRLALSELLSKRAGAKLQTLVIDEGFGSQDQLGRQKLAEVINPIKEEFALILIITHIESLKDAFPNRIIVEKTEHGSVAFIS